MLRNVFELCAMLLGAHLQQRTGATTFARGLQHNAEQPMPMALHGIKPTRQELWNHFDFDLRFYRLYSDVGSRTWRDDATLWAVATPNPAKLLLPTLVNR